MMTRYPQIFRIYHLLFLSLFPSMDSFILGIIFSSEFIWKEERSQRLTYLLTSNYWKKKTYLSLDMLNASGFLEQGRDQWCTLYYVPSNWRTYLCTPGILSEIGKSPEQMPPKLTNIDVTKGFLGDGFSTQPPLKWFSSLN